MLYDPEDHPLFTYRDLVQELSQNNMNIMVELPGHVIQDLVAYCESLTSQGSNCWNFCYDDGTALDTAGSSCKLTRVGGEPFDPKRIYRVGLWWMSLDYYHKFVPSLQEALPVLPSEDDGVRDIDLALGRLSVSIWGQLGSFCEIDANKDGRIGKQEIQEVLRKKFGDKASDVMVSNIFEIVNLDGDGYIDKVEYLKAMVMLTPQGTLTLEGVRKIAHKVMGKAGYNDALVAKVFALMDLDRDGTIEPLEQTAAHMEASKHHTSIQ